MSYLLRVIQTDFRNLVQVRTRKYKKEVGKCEHCEKTLEEVGQLDFAHKDGYERSMIVKSLYDKYYNHYSDPDLMIEKMEKEYKEIHAPYNLKNIGLVLCVPCHRKYDEDNSYGDGQKNLEDMKSPKESPIYFGDFNKLNMLTEDGRDYSRFRFNGMSNLNKRMLVKEIWKQYLLDNSNLTYEDIISDFPLHIRSGLVATIEEAYAKKHSQKSRQMRFYIDEDCQAVTPNGTYVFSNQWGIKELNNFLSYASALGYEVIVE